MEKISINCCANSDVSIIKIHTYFRNSTLPNIYILIGFHGNYGNGKVSKYICDISKLELKNELKEIS